MKSQNKNGSTASVVYAKIPALVQSKSAQNITNPDIYVILLCSRNVAFGRAFFPLPGELAWTIIGRLTPK
jgi:hypothetical protein